MFSLMPDQVRVSSTACSSREYGIIRAYNHINGELIWERGSCNDPYGMFIGQESLGYGFGTTFCDR